MAATETSENTGCWWVAIAAIGLGAIAWLSDRSSNSDQQVATPVATAEADVAEELPAPVLPLASSSTTRAVRDFQRVITEPGGDKIYSQNCYEALAGAFSWPKLDACGAFDQMVIRWIDSAAYDGGSDLDYFGPEAAATRYLSSATGHGEAATDADQRLFDLQRNATRARIPLLSPPSADESTDDEELDEALEADPLEDGTVPNASDELRDDTYVDVG